MLRALILGHRHIAIAVLAAALLVRALVPAGFMVSASQDTVVTITICAESSGGRQEAQIVIPGKQNGADHSEAASKNGTCAFAGLGQAALGGADIALLALALAFILALGFAARPALPVRQTSYLRPPLRGPPAAA